MGTTVDVPAVAGDKVKEVRDMTPEEQESSFGDVDRFSSAKVIIMESGVKIFPSKDPEGNGAGCLFGEFKGTSFYV